MLAGTPVLSTISATSGRSVRSRPSKVMRRNLPSPKLSLGGVQLLQKVQDGQGRRRVQGRRGLVAQQHLGVRAEGPGDGHPLALAAGELGGVGVLLLGKAHPSEELFGLGLRFLLGNAGQLQGEAHVIEDAPLLQQVEALEDHADVPPLRPELLLGKLRQLLPVHDHRARRGLFQQVDAPHQGALARARQTDDPEDLPLVYGQVHVLQRGDGPVPRAEGLGDALQFYDRITHPVLFLSLYTSSTTFGGPPSPPGEGVSNGKTPDKYTSGAKISRYHLDFTSVSRRTPYGVPTHSCAMTGAPVADYLSPARLRDHVPRPIRAPLPPLRGSLGRT